MLRPVEQAGAKSTNGAEPLRVVHQRCAVLRDGVDHHVADGCERWHGVDRQVGLGVQGRRSGDCFDRPFRPCRRASPQPTRGRRPRSSRLSEAVRLSESGDMTPAGMITTVSAGETSPLMGKKRIGTSTYARSCLPLRRAVAESGRQVKGSRPVARSGFCALRLDRMRTPSNSFGHALGTKLATQQLRGSAI